MAIDKGIFNDHEGNIKITNGDLEALKKVAEDYKLADETDVFGFALGILSRAEGNAVSVTLKNGRVMSFLPAEKLKKKPGSSEVGEE